MSLLRMDTSGGYSSIILGTWNTFCTGSSGTVAVPTSVNVITDADQGVFVSWALQTAPFSPGYGTESTTYYVAVTNGASVIAQGPTTKLVQPVLQGQDGSFYGTDSDGMIKIDRSGNIQWSVPNDSPQIATADGGVIGTSGSTYDSQGHATGQVATPIQSWTGNTYQYGSVEQVASAPVEIAQSFWPLSAANPSRNSAARIQESMYIRSFAPWQWFGIEPYPIPCSNNCFLGDDRSFSTGVTATARVTGILKFWMPGAILGSSQVFSSPSHDIYGRTAKAHPAITTTSGVNGYALHMEFAGSNPLVPGSPAINTKLDFTPVWSSGKICYSGHLYGDAFPNAENFVVNSQGQSTMLLTFTTPGDPNTGPAIYLLGDNNRDMGSFTQQCVGR